MSNWYYMIGEEKLGPIDDAKLEELIGYGVINADTMVWTEGWREWKNALAAGLVRPELPEAERSKTFAVIAMVFGVFAVLSCQGFLFGLPAFLTSIVAIVQIRRGRASGMKFAVIGLICSIISIIPSIVILRLMISR